ncbi:S53 family peptidase [Robbsia sp. Bb-Pol-6]|uniref:S53 family peptidase n=1 Tax=Robbsia betulipollinis TaxID=2981849 RepID=A0ABT3ZMB3_9BURK|nr:S53 family peptidase [Robbsia betulipollinis]MCY0387093.1 S53 family peptidase [Robbsia betulipollinis]
MAKHVLAGSERAALPGARLIGPADENEKVQVSLILRRADASGFHAHLASVCAPVNAGSGAAPRALSREAYRDQYGAAPADLETVRAFAAREHLDVVREDACSRTVVLAGSVAQCNAAFDVDLQRYRHDAGDFRGRTGVIHLPAELKDVVTAVLGLDDRPQARAHRLLRPAGGAPGDATTGHATQGGARDTAGEATEKSVPARPPVKPALSKPQERSYTPLELAALYGFPDGDGSGQCIGIIELGGGYATSDLNTYFTGLGLALPKVVAVSVDGTGNAPSDDPNGPDGEVALDIEIAGALAPKATLAVYFAPNSDAGFVDALNAAIHDTVNRPSVISLSWGSPESSWTAQSISALDDVLQSAATLGVTVCVASGDSGSSDGVADHADHVDFPASSRFALGCGGTRLSGSGTTIQAETVWNDGARGGAGGGGVSAHFPLPDWQKGLSVTRSGGKSSPLAMRGVPDVAGDADPESGYQILVHGQPQVVGGTSAVAPLWAGLIARINAGRSAPLGYLNPRLYAQPGVCRDVVQGNNGTFHASPGWDACTGLGSPDGSKLAAL